MCTLIVAVQAFEGVDLLVAANRDERLDRPSSPPVLRTDRALQVVAPVDEKAGGTWLGLNSASLFAGITNRFGSPPDQTRRSRGFLVFEALEQSSAVGAADRMASVDPQGTNRFHLLVADRRGAHLVWSDGEKILREDLGTGIHVLTERSRGAASSGRADWIAGRLPARGGPAPDDRTLHELLSFHHPDDPFEGTCVHADWLGYGTRSSTILRIDPDPEACRLLHAEGPPCESAYRDLTDLVVRLLV